VGALKSALRSRGMRYRDVAAGLGLSEASVKRLFAEETFSLRRFAEVCALIDMSVSAAPRLITLSGSQAPGTADIPADVTAPPQLVGPPKPAAVLVALAEVRHEWHVLYIRRARNERDHHSGQVAFPGGRFETGDGTLERAALREAHEEIGLDPGVAHVIGSLTPYLTITNYRVTPFVCTIPWPYRFVPAPDEVDRVFTIPLPWLADSDNHELRPRQPPVPGKAVNVVYFRRYDGELLWGATARMTLSLLAALRID